MHQSFLIHSSADGHLDCSHVLAIINSAAMNIGVHVFLSDLVSSVCMHRNGIAEKKKDPIFKANFIYNFFYNLCELFYCFNIVFLRV